jgi:DNA-binding MarR family transcriptional regulator
MAHEFANRLQPLGLRPPHFGVLTLIDAEPCRTQQELVERSMIDPSSMVSVIDELERLGLAQRRVDPSDRRKRAVHLTPRGRRMLERARAVAMQTAQDVLAPLDEKERQTLRALLRKLAGAEAEAPSARN